MIFQKETMIHATLITSPVQTALVIDVNICITAKGNVLEEALKMADFKWMKDEICANVDYPCVRTTAPIMEEN